MAKRESKGVYTVYDVWRSPRKLGETGSLAAAKQLATASSSGVRGPWRQIGYYDENGVLVETDEGSKLLRQEWWPADGDVMITLTARARTNPQRRNGTEKPSGDQLLKALSKITGIVVEPTDSGSAKIFYNSIRAPICVISLVGEKIGRNLVVRYNIRYKVDTKYSQAVRDYVVPSKLGIDGVVSWVKDEISVLS